MVKENPFDQVKSQIRSIQQQGIEGHLGIVEAVDEIDRAIGGIVRVEFKSTPGKFSIANSQTAFSLKAQGYSNCQKERLHDMAVVAYHKAQQNGQYKPGGVHISERASTKHYREGIDAIMQKYR